MKFFRYIRAAILFARSFPYNPDQNEVPWTDADGITAMHFFSQGTGKKLMLRLEMGVVNLALISVQKGDLHQCGVANGAAMQLAAIRNHFPLGVANNADTEESEQEAALDSFAEGAA